MNAIAAQAVQMQAGALSQSIGVAVARQQIAADQAVTALVAGSATPAAPPGQGTVVDMKV